MTAMPNDIETSEHAAQVLLVRPRTRSRTARPHRRRGQALVPVIFIMVILTILAVAISLTSHRDVEAGSNYANQIRRFYAARGALNYALSSLAQTSNNGATYGVVQPDATADANGWWQMGEDWVKVEVVDTGSRININTVPLATLQMLPLFQSNPDLAQAIIDWRTAQTAQSNSSATTAQPADNGENEYYQGLPVPYSSKSAPFDTVDELLLVKGMTPAMLYGSAGGAPVSASDVQQATASAGIGRAVTRQAAPTAGAQAPGTTAPGASTPGTANGAQSSTPATPADFADIYADSKVPLAELLTTTSRERNVAADGTARVNINTATAQVLQQKLGISANLANRLVNFRNPSSNQGGSPGGRPRQPGAPNPGGPQPGGAPGPGGVPRPGGVPGPNNGGPAPGTGFGRPRSIYGTRQAAPIPGGAAPAPVQGGANGQPTNGQMPNAGAPSGNPSSGNSTQVFKTLADLLAVPGFSRTIMQSIADHIAVDDNPNRDWVININTAPPEVLATAPGMTRPVLDAITQYRQGGQVFQTLGDLFSIQSITLAQYQNVLPRLATKTSTYVVHIKVRSPGQNGIYAASALVEMTSTGPKVNQWREIARAPGWSTWGRLPVMPTPTQTGGTTAGSAGSAGP